MSIAPGSHRTGAAYLEMPEVGGQLGEFLPTALIAFLAGVRDVGQVSRWAHGEIGPEPNPEARLRFALDQAHRIAEVESVKTADSWLTSANERLGYTLPLKAIREDHFKEVADAVDSFVDGYAG